MKKLYLLVLVNVIAFTSQAQTVGINENKERKQGLFRQLPDTIPVELSSLQAILRLQAGSEVVIDLSQSRQHPIQGTVVASSDQQNGKRRSVSVSTPKNEGAVFHISNVVLDDGKEMYRGTWMHKDYNEIFVLTHTGREYVLLKKKFKDLVME